ncbi:MAG: glucose-1-phosphate cytidylyltransferase [Deltaproteobacteria bacterium]|nr:glucose-1-phosphate cytidylyltransferase [Deltaproteobacteria bacterium]
MKVVILAGGLGTRLAEETELRPKPMVEIAGRPILWHIMKSYSAQGLTEFVIALGYKGDQIKKYVVDYAVTGGDLSVDLGSGQVTTSPRERESWRIHLRDTGVETMTGGRLQALQEVLGDETFMLTYGDGVADVDVAALLAHHRSQGKVGTITAVRPPARFGALELDEGMVKRFSEKSQADAGWINGGFMVFEPSIFKYLSGPACVLEQDALEQIASEGELAAYRHEGFWQCMDTLREKRYLDSLWREGKAPWKRWT